MEVSIIIVNYNTSKYIEACLQSIYENTKDIEFEILVADNASVDNSVELIKSKYKDVKLIESKENLGFARANNLAAKSATGKYLFFLNPDTKLVNNAVKLLFDFMEGNKACFSGGLLFNESMQKVHSYGHLHTIKSLICTQTLLKYLFKKQRHYYNNYEDIVLKDKPFEVEYVTGADLMVKRDVFEKLNGFCEKFFMYFEDTELSFRAKKQGYNSYIVPDAKIQHFEGKSVLPQKRVKSLKSKFLYYKLCYGILGYFAIATMFPKFLKYHFKSKL